MKCRSVFLRSSLHCLPLFLTFLGPLYPGQAQLLLSGNEGKIDLTSGSPKLLGSPRPDSISILDFSSFPPSVTHLPDISNTVIGPPSNIGITPDGALALIADSLKLDPADKTRWIPNDRIHLLDLSSQPPALKGSVNAGAQPSGLSIAKDGRLAMVANRADGTVTVLSLKGHAVDVLYTLKVCDAELSASDVAIHPNGSMALVSIQKGGYLALLELNEDQARVTGRQLSVYGQPYRCVITPDGELGLTAGAGTGNGLDSDALSVVDLESMTTTDHIPIGAVPESIEVSPDGQLVAAVLMAGSNLDATNPLHSNHGEIALLARRGRTFERVQVIKTGRIPEGVAFTSDGRYLVVQAHPEEALWIYEVQGGKLKDTGERISVPGFPSSLRAAP